MDKVNQGKTPMFETLHPLVGFLFLNSLISMGCNMEPKFLRDAAIRFKEHMERNYPHKDIAEFTRLIDALDTFIKYAVWSDMDLE